MTYILGGITLPNPKELIREQVETAGTVNTINGITKKDIVSRKERFTLVYQMLSQANASILLGIWGGQDIKTFQVTETNLTINPTSVHVEIEKREYTTKGNTYREDITLVLTEVS